MRKRQPLKPTPDGIRLYTIPEARAILNLGEKAFRQRWHDDKDPLRKHIIVISQRVHRMTEDGIKAYLTYMQTESLNKCAMR